MYKDTVGSPFLGRARKYRATASAAVEPPSGYRIVSIDTPSCERLRDATSLRWDLESAIIFCEAFMDQEVDLESEQRPASEALWLAAVLNYGRAFGTGVRTTERLDPGMLSAEERAQHNFFIDLRNKHVAHSVNAYEQVLTLAYITNSPFASKEVTRVGQTHLSVTPMGSEEIAALRELASKFVRQLNRTIWKLHVIIGAELAEVGLDEVYSYPDLSVSIPSNLDVSKRR